MAEEPVSIDILLNQNVESESEKASKAITNLADTSWDAWKRSEEGLKLQRDVITRLKKELESLEKEFAKVNVSDPKLLEERRKVKQAIIEVKTELKGEEAALKEVEAANNSYKNSQSTLLTQMRNVRNEMAQLKLSGEQESDMYKKKEEALKSLATAHRELTEEQKLLSSGSAQMQGVLSGLSGLSGALSTAGGAFGLFNQNSEEYAKIQTKVQSLMAITIGLQQIQNTLHQTSAFRITTVTKAKHLWSAANLKVATTLGISTVAAKALMATLTLGLSVAIGAVIAITDKLIAKQREQKKEQNQLNESIASNSASQIANYEKLRVSYNRLGEDIKEKEKFIKDNQDAFKALGVSISDINDADSAFIANTNAFKEAIRQRAIATAAMELAAEQYKKMLQEREKVQAKVDAAAEKSISRMEASAKIESGAVASDNIKIQPQLQLDPIIQPVSQEKANAVMDVYLSDAERKYANAGDKWVEKSVTASEEEMSILKALGLAPTDIKTTSTKTKTPEDPAIKAGERLAKLSTDIQKDIDAAVIAAMQEGRDKKLAELENEYNQRMKLIADRQAEIKKLEAEAGVDGSAQSAQLDALASAEKNKYEIAVNAVNEGSAAAISSVWEEINSRFASETELRLSDIDNFYKAQIAKARENGATQQEIDNISLAHKKDIEIEKQNIALEALDFETQIAIRKAEIEDREVWLQAEREEKILSIQIEAIKKRISKLNELKASGQDVDKDIKAAEVELKAFNKELEKMPTKKLKEAAAHFKDILGSLSEFGGEFGEAMSAMASQIDNITTSFDKNATNIDKISAGISGLASLYNMAAQQIEENKRKQEEWNDAIQEGEHRARLARIELKAYSESNIFGVENPYARAISGAKEYAASMQELHSVIATMGAGKIQTGTKKVVSGKNVVSGVASGAAVGAAVGSFVPVIGNAVGAVIGGILGGIFGATQKKVVPVFESLSKQFGSILKDGTETFELNPKILENYAKLDDATKKLVDNWEEIRTKALEAQKQMEDNFRDLAGNIGDMLSKSLVDSFRNGDLFSAVDGFGEKVTGVIEDIVEKMVFATHFQKYFDELQERMKKSYGDGGDGTIVDDIIWFSKVYKEAISEYGKDMEEAREELRKQGFDAFTPNETSQGRKAVAQGFQSVTQDSFDEFSGRVTYIVMRLTSIGESVNSSNELSREQLLIIQSMAGYLETIAENSFFLERLAVIDENIERIARDGINLKK